MVRIAVKSDSHLLFHLETTLDQRGSTLKDLIVKIQNGRLKIHRICDQIQCLAQHGIQVHPQRQGLLEEQIQELKLEPDANLETFQPDGGYQDCPDPLQQRTGRAPKEEMQEILKATIDKVKANMKKEEPMKWERVQEALDMLKGAVRVVYPQGLPDYDPVQMELDNKEDLSGTQAGKEVLDPEETTLWFANKELDLADPLSKRLGRNEKTKVVFKVSSRSQGRPPKEGFSPETQKKLQMDAFKRMEEIRRLERDADNSHLNSPWADSGGLQRKFQGLSNISWK